MTDASAVAVSAEDKAKELTDSICEDLAADVAECQRLAELSTREAVTEALTQKARSLTITRENRIEVLKAAAAAEATRLQAGSAAGAGAGAGAGVGVTFTYRPLTSFSWDKGTKKVSVRVSKGIDGVGELDKDLVTCDFTATSFDLKIHNLGGANYRLHRENLSHKIIPTKSSIKIKPNAVVVLLAMSDSLDSWHELQEKPSSKKKAGSDPTAGIMDMMKGMYQDGDDDTKRVIAEAWSKAQESRATGKSILPDMPLGGGL